MLEIFLFLSCKDWNFFQFFSNFYCFYKYLQSDIIYSPTPGTSMDVLDAPCRTPMPLIHEASLLRDPLPML